KRSIVFLFEKRNIFSSFFEKIFPMHYLNKRFNFLKDTLESLEKDLRHYIEKNTEFDTESIKASLNLILQLKILSLIEKEEIKHKKGVTALRKEENKIIDCYFKNKSISDIKNIKENLEYLIFLKKEYNLQSDINKYENLEKDNHLKEDELYNHYYRDLSKEAREYFKSKKERQYVTPLLSQMKTQKEILGLYQEITKIEQVLLDSQSIYNIQQDIQTFKEQRIKISRSIFENYWFKKIKETSIHDENHVSRYIDATEKLEKYIEDYSLWKQLVEEQEREVQELLSFLPIWVVTNLSAKNSLPLKENLFDLLIIDEASQCDIASALPLFYRAKQVVIIGDPKQLKHISLLRETEDKKIASQNKIPELYLDYAYSKNSLYDISERTIKSKDKSPILLNQHYRSYKDIINFSNEHFYEKKLNIMTDESKLIPDIIHPKGIKWVDVCGKTSQTKSPYNKEEAIEMIKILKSFRKSNLKKISFGVVTLFRAQMELIANMIKNTKELKNMDITVGTTHRFQGDEKDIILFSPAISKDIKQTTLNWIHTTTQLLNVAITRARSVLIIVGDKKKCNETGGFLKSLVKYAESKKQVDINFDSPIEEKLFKKLTKERIKILPQYETKIRGKKPYRLDFALFINENKYDIEVDGDKAHSQKIESDILRDIHLRIEGWKVRRFQASEIYDNIDKVIEEIKRLC
ncbi:MAG: AAA domain-containing protein, partial [Nanoarchaeota archaeon]|nr:AAA domain-containing protein [Nanoarchaeota archaeon]